MPNHVTTIIKAAPAVIDALRGTGERAGSIDFNNLIPFPEELQKLSAEFKVFLTQAEVDTHQAKEAAAFAKWPAGLGPSPDTIFALTIEQHADLVQKYGSNLDWYSWNTHNWGTKWNAYEVEFSAERIRALPALNEDETKVLVIQETAVAAIEEGTVVKFETAWSFPEPVIIALSERFPAERIEVAFADEDLGHNYGIAAYLAGAVVDGSAEPFGRGTDAAHEFAARVKYGKSYAELRAEWDED